MKELRELAQGIHPAVLSDYGLGVALESVANRASLPVELSVAVEGPLPPAVEVAAYYLVCEALTNVAKYASASCASVEITREDGQLIVQVADDGIGGADPASGSGLRGLADRVEALDGSLRVWSPRGEGDDGAGRDAVRVAVADDALLLREGIARLLAEAGFEVVAQCSTARGAAGGRSHRSSPRRRDHRHPDAADAHATKACGRRERSARAYPGMGIVILSQHADIGVAAKLLADSAVGVGYMLKESIDDLEEFAGRRQARRRRAARCSTRRSCRNCSAAGVSTTRSNRWRRASARCCG